MALQEVCDVIQMAANRAAILDITEISTLSENCGSCKYFCYSPKI